ncbi:acyl-CoA-binding domain-containing protein 3 [Amborella trichopoda]|uniref:ACB domain-containing protein n=1 Tax=Amborella trichopoda TaxID=13333 RepID=W1Q0D1_AMBTC|nr:acyl-CoA-binding domain-containing protein 3 [Amborella trichopoda]ERN13375.1 hypothetical protein AMTR_s00041p00158160 [Amborella trichopoda]|eukprot:XP_006851908.1 acyl-CoA-binding domain-containing protein 3 [Amborella trichopoda]
MEILQELLITAFISLVLAFLIAKLVSDSNGEHDPSPPSNASKPNTRILSEEEPSKLNYTSTLQGSNVESASATNPDKNGDDLAEEMVNVQEFALNLAKKSPEKDTVNELDLGSLEREGKFLVAEELDLETLTDTLTEDETVGDVNPEPVPSVTEEQEHTKPCEFEQNSKEEPELVDAIKSELELEKEESKPVKVSEVEEKLTEDGTQHVNPGFGEERIEKEKTSGEKEELLLEDKGEPASEDDKVNNLRANERESLLGDDEEWEGIERSDLEKLFAVASKFVESESNELLSRVGSDVQMQLYGLHKVATEGTCYGSQPSALKISARAKWNAWQRLGIMNPEVAMEQYIDLLSDKIPGWKEKIPEVGGIYSPKAGISLTADPVLCSSINSQATSESERKKEDIYDCGLQGDTIGFSNMAQQDIPVNLHGHGKAESTTSFSTGPT